MATKSFRPDLNMVPEWEPVESQPTLPEIAAANFKLALMNSETLSIGRIIQSELLGNDNDILTAKQANEQYPTQTPWIGDVSAATAAAVKAQQDEKLKLERVISRGDNVLGSSFLGFTSSLAGAALDPIGILAGKSLAGFGGSILNRAFNPNFIKGTIRRNILEQSIEGALGNVATEAAIVLPARAASNEDTEVVQSLLFAALAGAAFPAVINTTSVLYKGFKNFDFKQFDDATNITEARIMADKNPNMSQEEFDLIANKGGALVDELKELDVSIKENQGKLRQSTDLDEANKFKDEIEKDQLALLEKDRELQEYKNTIDDAEAVRARANSESNNIYNNPEINEKIETINDEPDVSFIEQSNALVERLDELNLEPEVRAKVDASIKQYSDAATQIDQLIKDTQFCVNKGE